VPKYSTVLGASLFIGLLCALTILIAGLNEEAVRLTIRLTAATSYILLICAFTARPWYQLRHSAGAKTLMRQRRQIGISMAISHSFHLAMIFLLGWVAYDGDISLRRSLADLGPGIVVYVILYLMAITSNNYSQRLLGKNWKALHTAGIYSLMLAFTGAYTGNALETGGLYWLTSIVGLAAFLLRYLAWRAGPRHLNAENSPRCGAQPIH
jgi:sulfoxide reductase heme-binding subunit YedZ